MSWFNNLRTFVKLMLAFSVLLALTLVMGLFAVSELAQVNETSTVMEVRWMPSVKIAGELESQCGLFRRSELQHVLSTDETVMADYEKRMADVEAAIEKAAAELGRLSADPEDKRLLADFQSGWKTYRDISAKLLVLSRQNRTEEARALLQGDSKKAYDHVDEILIAVTKRSMEGGKAASQAGNELYAESRLFIYGLIAVTVLLGLGLAVLVGRAMARPLGRAVTFAEEVAGGRLDSALAIDQKDEVGRLAEALRHMVGALKAKIAEADDKSRQAAAEAERARTAMAEAESAKALAEAGRAAVMVAVRDIEQIVERLTSSSQELSAQVEQSSRGAELQSERVGETATSMEEMNATVMEVAKNASTAAERSEDARVKAAQGADMVKEVVKSMAALEASAQGLKQQMAKLGSEAEDIGRIITVIEDIADQTNLLALNAAIEAARAGDAGRGFAVVADEVRKLAEKTMGATKEVGQAITAIQHGTRANMDSVDKTVTGIQTATRLSNESGAVLGVIVGVVEAATDQVRAIATASEEQSAASEEINHAIEDINRISSETATAMTQSAQAVVELAAQAERLQEVIRELRAKQG